MAVVWLALHDVKVGAFVVELVGAAADVVAVVGAVGEIVAGALVVAACSVRGMAAVVA